MLRPQPAAPLSRFPKLRFRNRHRGVFSMAATVVVAAGIMSIGQSASAQLIEKTQTASTRTAWRSLNETPRYDASLLPPVNATTSPYAFLRETLPPDENSTARGSRRVNTARPATFVSNDQPLIFRGQQPGAEIVREEIVPADERPRLNSPPDAFRSVPRPASPTISYPAGSPACQSPTYYRSPTVYRGYAPSYQASSYKASSYQAPTLTRFYNATANPGGLPESRYQIGRGVIGQPTLYVKNQPVRNFIRWLTF